MKYNESNTVGLDFETYGTRNMKDVGLENYVRDPYFQVQVGRLIKRLPTSTLVSKYDFVLDRVNALDQLRRDMLSLINNGWYIAAHNAPFEKRVLKWLDIDMPAERFIDSAVIAHAAGAGAKLEQAAPQLLDTPKMVEGKRLIQVFSVPTKAQRESGDLQFDANLAIGSHADWQLFGEYCEVDASQSLDLVCQWGDVLTHEEPAYAAVTTEMNEMGWPVDVDLVKEMQRRYEENMAQELAYFRAACNAPDLNLNSQPQLKKWCEARGVKANSFDKDHVEVLIKRLDKKLDDPSVPADKVLEYAQVLNLCRTKQALGGSNLKKLDVILRTQVDGRLHNQYFHAGAGQSMRTTGRSAQMQNLKRLGADVADMGALLADTDVVWDNNELSDNIRQVFTSSDPQGQLLVGDFKSVESRGLAYQAGEEWKLAAYRGGDDLYKVLASKIYSIQYEDVTKQQRMVGKVGELACGYGAGGDAVVSFAAGMGVELTPGEAAKLVSDWREANPKIVGYWNILDDLLHSVVEDKMARQYHLPNDNLIVKVEPWLTPTSLDRQHPGSQSVMVKVTTRGGRDVLKRVFNGCYIRGRNVAFYKPSTLQSGQLWAPFYTDPKTKQRRYYDIYGGKLAGILTQSLCREIFMECLLQVNHWAHDRSNVDVIGQFHDEIVLDWQPGATSLDLAMVTLERLMSNCQFASFPLEADIKHDYRYTK